MSGPASRRHTGEPTTSEDKTRLLTWLKHEGERLGFHIEEGYTSPEGDTADEAWLLNEKQKPIITFSVEPDPVQLMATALQWTGSSTEPKSWRHLCILTADAPPLPEFPDQLHGGDKPAILRRLEEITQKMTELLRTFTDDEPGGSLPDTVRRLAAITASWPKEMWASRLTLKTRTAFDPDCLSLFAAETEEDDEAETPVLQPSRKVVPLDVIGGDTTFEGALMRLIEANDGHLLFSTEHRNYPFIFRLATPMDGGESKLDLWFDVDKSNIPQALRFRELLDGITSTKQAALICPSGELARITL